MNMNQDTIRIAILTDSTTLSKYIALGLDSSRYLTGEFFSTDPNLFEVLRDFAPDIVLIKKELRAGDGIELRERLRVRGLEARAVFMSSHLDTVKRGEGAAAESSLASDYYLHIPFNGGVLRKIIHRLTARESTVLYAEDSELLHKILVPYLSSRGLRVLPARRGDEALQILERENVDIVVSDIEMPGLDGFELCRRMRAHDRLKDVPFIVTSSLNGDNEIRRGFLVGVNDYITKPFLGLELLQRIENHLGMDPDQPRREERILVVEDNRLTREIIVEALGYNGFSALQAGTGAAALAQLEQGEIDLVITASRLGGESDGELLTNIRRSEKTRSVPIIVTTMNRDENPSLEETVRMESLGIEGVIGVPFNFSQLLVIVERVLAFARSKSSGVESPLLA